MLQPALSFAPTCQTLITTPGLRTYMDRLQSHLDEALTEAEIDNLPVTAATIDLQATHSS